MKQVFTFLLTLLVTVLSGQFTVSGTVTNQSGEPLDFASVFIKNSDYATATDPKGKFELSNVEAGKYILKVSFIGYESIEQEIEVIENLTLQLKILGTPYNIDQIEIQANRATFQQPVTNSEISKEEIENNYIAQDVPYILRWMPSVTVTSDAGAGIGYTGIRVRGSEASRTNVTINGVPLNDSESQSVFWVNMPDFLSNTNSIQIQRGVGLSTIGTSAFGANVNLSTQSFHQNSFAHINTGVGSFGTNKIGVKVGTGLLNNKYAIEARYTRIGSQGYVDRASSALNSYFFSASRITEGSSLRLNIFSGGERTYQAWNGLPIQYLDSIRRYNTAGTAKPGVPYENEIDNYRQTHGQLIYNIAVGEKSILNLTAHITQGAGYFENYKANAQNIAYNLEPDSITQDIIIQRWLENFFYGVIGTFDYKSNGLEVLIGGAINQYDGDHFGEVIWRQTDIGEKPRINRYYGNDARKREGNVYTRLSYNLKGKFIPFIDLQYRAVSYTYEGGNENRELIKGEDLLGFFNPKFGLSVLPNKQSKIYAFYGISNREPSRDEYILSNEENRPNPENLQDLELGFTHNSKSLNLDLTLFNMNYKDQLIPTGKLGNSGEPIRVNVPESYRRGVELSLNTKLNKHLSIGYTGTLSQNKIKSFSEFIDNWDTGEQVEIVHENTDISYSPNQLHVISSRINLLPNQKTHELAIQANYKFVGEQYLDNTGNENSLLSSFSFLDMMVNYRTSYKKLKELGVNLQVNNVLNNKYVNNGWIYRFQTAGIPASDILTDPYARSEGANNYNLTGVFPQATLNFLLGVSFKF